MPQPRRGGARQRDGAGGEPGPLPSGRRPGERQAIAVQPGGELDPGLLQLPSGQRPLTGPGQVTVGQHGLLRRGRGGERPLQHRGAVTKARPRHGDRDERADQHQQGQRGAGGGPGTGHGRAGRPSPGAQSAPGAPPPRVRVLPPGVRARPPGVRRGLPAAHAESPRRSWAAGSGWYAAPTAAVSTGTAATTSASTAVQPSGITTRTGGNGVAAPPVRVTAGTSSQARPTPINAPAIAAGTLSMSCSRQSWPVRARRPTPSAASSASWRRRSVTAATTQTTNPMVASSAAARAITSSASWGTFGSGSPSNAAAAPARVAAVAPAGSLGEVPGAVRSHHPVTGTGGCDCAVSAPSSEPRSTMTAGAVAAADGNARIAATSRTGTVAFPTGSGMTWPG